MTRGDIVGLCVFGGMVSIIALVILHIMVRDRLIPWIRSRDYRNSWEKWNDPDKE